MSATTGFEYTELDAATRLQMVRGRIRDLETQYQQLSLRVDTPAPGEIITQQDQDNLAMLQTSLDRLHAQESELLGPAPAPAA